MKSNEEIIKSGLLWDVTSLGFMNTGFIKLPDCKTCSVCWFDNECGWEYVSVSPKHKFNVPTWNDMCVLKDVFFGDEEEVYQIHPPKSQYVNLVDNCLHLWKPIGIDLNKLVQERAEAK